MQPAQPVKRKRWYHAYIAKLPGGDRAEWNYDVTLSPGSEERLLRRQALRRWR